MIAWRDSLDGTSVLNFWEAFDMLEPIGLPGLDQITAVQTARLASASTGQPQHPDDCHAIPDCTKLASSVTLSSADRVAAEQAKFS